MQKYNDWNVSYSVITFVERALTGHDKVQSFERSRDILFRVVLQDDREIVFVLVNEYVLGLAAVLRARAEFPEADYVVTGGSWNSYTREAKEYGQSNDIGIFNIQEFLGALNWSEPKTYHQRDRDGKPIYAYKSA